jgi:hypothetical protein
MQSAGSAATISNNVRLLPMFSDETVQERFVRFHHQYPKVYDLFRSFALKLIQTGHKQIGARMIIERIRWEFATGSKDEMGFKINNDFIAHYARMFQNEYPVYKEFIETRAIRKP